MLEFLRATMSGSLRNQKIQFWVILTIVFFGFLGISMPYLIFPPLFLSPEYSFLPKNWSESARAIFLGVTLAVYPLGQFFGSPILGGLSDDYGRKWILSGSLVISAICNLLSGLAIAWEQLGWLIASRFVAGFMEGNIAIARALCADLNLLSKHKTFGKMNAAISIAFLIGPLLGALMTNQNLSNWLSAAFPFYFICILFFALAGLSSLTIDNFVNHIPIKSQTIWARFNILKRTSRLLSNQSLKILLIASTCFTLAVDIFYQFAPVYLTLKWSLVPVQLILYNGLLCVGLAIGNGWLPHFIASRTSSWLSTIGAIGGFSLVLIGIILTHSTIAMLAWFFLGGIVIGLGVTLLTVKISDSAIDSIQGEVMGTQLSLRVLGDAIICLIGGALLTLSSKIILALASALSLSAMIYYQTKGPRSEIL